MQEADRYFAYCYFPTSNKYCVLPSKFLKPRPKVKESSAGVAWATLGDEYWGATFRSAWNDKLEVFPKEGIFLDGNLKNDEDFEFVLADAEYCDCFVLATASSVEQLQKFIAKCQIKIPKLKRKLLENPNLEIAMRAVETDALSPKTVTNDEKRNPRSDHLPEGKIFGPQEQNHESAGIKLTDLEMAKLEEILKQGETEDCPEGDAKLGYFELESDGKITKENATSVFVLVVHYDFKNTDRFRKCDKHDLENLRTTFRENRNCNMRELLSPNKMILLELLSNQEMLLRFFRSKDAPDLFVLFVLSHGNENGTIFTDHRELNEFVSFTTDEVFASLKKLTAFEKCLKLINFGPCRGTLTDDFVVSDSNENRNACRITFHPAIHNMVIFYSTVEMILANTSEIGSFFIRNFCDCLNWITDGTPLLQFLTFVQHFIHNGTIKGQSPELKMFPQDKKFVLWGMKKTDGSGDRSRIITSLPGFYSWRSELGNNIRGRRAFILFEEHKKDVLEMENALHQNLDFETSEWRLSESNLNLYFERVSKLEHDVGCILTCIFGQICENEGKEVCVLVDKKKKPITDILCTFVGPKNRKWIGKPKIFFLVSQKARETGTDSLLTCSDAHISASNHSGWLVLILNDEDTLMQLIRILQGQELKQDKKSSLQELLAPLLISKTKAINILLNSTLHCCLNFPDWPRTFMKPELTIKTDGNSPFQKIGFDELIDKVKLSSKQSQMDDSSGANSRETENSVLAWLLSSVAGAGKTTVLKEMAYQLAKFDLGIKVLQVSLKKHSIYMMNMSEVEINIVQFLAETTWTDPDDMKNWVEKRKVVVFFDGFSEILSSQREKVLKIAWTLQEMRIPFIVGARPHETEGILKILDSAAIVAIQPLDEEKQRELLRSVAGKKEAVVEKLVKNIELQDVMGNPLYLLLLAESHFEASLFEIFDRVVRKNMKICMERDNGDKEVTDENVEINLDHLRLIAHHSLSRFDVVADETLENMCILGFTTVSAGKVNFVYESIAKFLAAQWCLKNRVDA